MVLVGVPEGRFGEREGTKANHFVVVDRVAGDLVALGFEESDFGAEDLVLTAGLLVVVVDQDNIHV